MYIGWGHFSPFIIISPKPGVCKVLKNMFWMEGWIRDGWVDDQIFKKSPLATYIDIGLEK